MSIIGGVAAPRGQSQADVVRAATSPSGYRWQVFASDFLIVALVCVASPLLLGFTELTAFPTPVLVSIAVAVSWIAMLAVVGAYRVPTPSGLHSLWLVAKSAAFVLAAAGVVSYLLGAMQYRDRVLLDLAIGIPLLLLARVGMTLYLTRLRAAGHGRVSMLLVAPTQSSSTLVSSFNGDPCYAVAGVANPDRLTDAVKTIALRAVDERVDCVLVNDPAALGHDGVRRLAWELEDESIALLVDTGVTRFASGRSSLTTVSNESVIRIDHSHNSKLMLAVKRAMDIVISGTLLLIIAPAIAVIALAIKIESPGPAFFVQPRVGQRGELFPFFKLRSMRVGAHLDRDAELGPTDEGILERYRNDSRITRIGKFIRRWSIDEMPQLANVFLGHMSLVGPRPVLVDELHDLPKDGGERVHLAKPGLTGLWQISGRKEILWEDRIDLDLDYIDGRSFAMDARILSKTAGAVLKGSGAY